MPDIPDNEVPRDIIPGGPGPDYDLALPEREALLDIIRAEIGTGRTNHEKRRRVWRALRRVIIPLLDELYPDEPDLFGDRTRPNGGGGR